MFQLFNVTLHLGLRFVQKASAILHNLTDDNSIATVE